MYDSFPVCRSIFNHWIFEDGDYLKVWIKMLGRARYLKTPKRGMYNGTIYTLNYGEFIFGIPTWSEENKISEQKLRTLIKKMLKDEMLEEIVKTNKFRIFKIINYEKFNTQTNNESNNHESLEPQGFDEYGNNQTNTQANNQSTIKQQSTNKQLTTNKESKKANKENKEKKDIYNEQIDTLWNMYPRKKGRADAVKKMPNLIKEYGYEQLERCVRRYSEEVKNIEEKFIKNGSTFFNGGYVDYLDSNYKGDVSKNGGYKSDNQPNYSYYDNQEYTGPIYDDSEFI